MLMVDETKLTNGTVSMMLQDYGVKGAFDLDHEGMEYYIEKFGLRVYDEKDEKENGHERD